MKVKIFCMDLDHYEYGSWRKIEVIIHTYNDLEKIAGLFCGCVWSEVLDIEKHDDPRLIQAVNDVLDSYRTHSTAEIIEYLHDLISEWLKEKK